MKKIIALVLSIVMICCLSLTVMAADSPSATGKVTLTVRKAIVVDPEGKSDTEYTFDAGTTITVKADSQYGKFNSWSVYKEETTANTGMVTLNAVANLASAKAVAAVEGTDYEIVKGSLTSEELTIKLNTPVIVCGNYDNTITDPSIPSNSDDSPSAPPTSDTIVVYGVIIMLAAVAFGFGMKKVYSK